MKSPAIKKKMVFYAMGNTVRRNIVAALLDGELSASDLAAGFDMSISGMMWHLQVLEDAGIIKRRKMHNRNVCRVNRGSLAEVADWLEIVETDWLDKVAIS